TPFAVTVMVSDPLAAGPPLPSCELTVRISVAVSPPSSGAVIRKAPRSPAGRLATPLLATSAVLPSKSVHPVGIPDTVAAVKLSSPSPDTAIPPSVIVDPGSSLPLKLVGPLKLGASATPLAVTVMVSDPLAVGPPLPSCALTVRVRTAVSPPSSGAVIRNAPRSPAGRLATPPVATSATLPSKRVHPDGIPDTVADVKLSSPSPDTAIPPSVIV